MHSKINNFRFNFYLGSEPVLLEQRIEIYRYKESSDKLIGEAIVKLLNVKGVNILKIIQMVNMFVDQIG